MQAKTTKKIIIDANKLETLLRLGCPEKAITDYIIHNVIHKQNDELIDTLLESLIDRKEFSNWGGKRDGSGRPKNQLENQLENQDGGQVVDKDIYNTTELNNNINIFKNKINLNKNQFLISDEFSLDQLGDDVDIYRKELGNEIVESVQDWIKKAKHGKVIDREFITSQFWNFAKRQGKKIA